MEREQRRIEREQKQILREMRSQKAAAKRNTASSKIPAKWYARGSKAIAIGDNTTGEKVVIRGGMFYAGSNVSDETMVMSRISEPSLINPLYEVRLSPAPVRRTDKDPIYATLLPEQRGEYLRFLASDRTQASDIGYPFVYLYGLERRLLVDTRKPGEVSDEERLEVSTEVLRLLRTFGPQSKSFALYAASLLLYDGKLAAGMGDEEFSSTFAGKLTSQRRDWHALTGAYEYMLLARMAERGMTFPEADFLNYCRFMPFFGNGASFLGYSDREMCRSAEGQSAWTLMVRRYESSSVAGEWPGPSMRQLERIGRRSVPEYAPGSKAIAKSGIVDIARALPDLDRFDAPFKQVADLGSTAMREVMEYRGLLDGGSTTALSSVHLDVIKALTPPRRLLSVFKGKKVLASVPHEVLAEEAAALGITAATTKTGTLNAQTQSAYQILAASLGWQVVLPDSLPKALGKFFKIGPDDDVLAFKRGGLYDRRNGVQYLGALVSPRDVSAGINLDDSWMSSVMASVVFAWFVRQLSGRLTMGEFTKYVSIFRPPIKKQRKTKQVFMFYCLVSAFLRYQMSPSAPRECLKGCDFQVVKRAAFAWCYDRYGLMLPHEVMDALEKLYARGGEDKSMILYDYHAFTAGDAPGRRQGDEFAIDDDRLRDIIEDTSGVHSILSGVMDADEDEEQDGDMELSEEFDASDIDISDEDIEAPTPAEDTGQIDLAAVAREYVKSLYADAQTDEMPTKALQAALMEQFDLPTTAAALGLLSDVNARCEAEGLEPLIEVDGPDAYLN